ncbi:hypothetical protein [Kitasatospora paranensis]|uniref:hypothetical protein n=1 Tax=Kitasatospora paranensis TaxID=258053 RepID=UPI0031EF2E58
MLTHSSGLEPVTRLDRYLLTDRPLAELLCAAPWCPLQVANTVTSTGDSCCSAYFSPPHTGVAWRCSRTTTGPKSA